MATELDFCRHLLDKFDDFWQKSKAPYLEVFLEPVDEVQDDAPGYYAQIKNPMDLTTMSTKLDNGDYADAQAFKADFDQMIKNCREYNSDNPDFIKKYADRFVKDFDWEWAEMRKWITTERRKAVKLARQTPAPAPAPSSAPAAAPSASTSGTQSPSSPRASASNAEPERSSGLSPSPSPSLGEPQGNDMATPRPAVFTVAPSSPIEAAVGAVLGNLHLIMNEQFRVVVAEKEAERAASTLAFWDKIWGPDRHQISMEMWRVKCRSEISPEGWPGSVAAIRDEVVQAWRDTNMEQLALVEQEEAAQKAEFLRHLEQ